MTIDCDAAIRQRGFVGDAFRLRQCLINLVRGPASPGQLPPGCPLARVPSPALLPATARTADLPRRPLPRCLVAQTDNAVKFSAPGKVVAVAIRQAAPPSSDAAGGPRGGAPGGLPVAGSDGPRTFGADPESRHAHFPERVTEVDEARSSTTIAELSRQWVQMTVQDQGEGMSPEAVKRLFKPFRCHTRESRLPRRAPAAPLGRGFHPPGSPMTQRLFPPPCSQPSVVVRGWPPGGHGPGAVHREEAGRAHGGKHHRQLDERRAKGALPSFL